MEIPHTHRLSSESVISIKQFSDLFGLKEFTMSQAQELSGYVLNDAYFDQEKYYLDHVKVVHVSKIPKSKNIISSHTLYSVKTNENNNPYIKARIIPHGNHDRLRSVGKTHAYFCFPIGDRIVCSIASIMS